MKAMILAAGLGTRLRPITEHTPKCLLQIAGKALIEHHLMALAQAGITEVVINVSHLAARVQAALGDGAAYGVRIQYSLEDTPLESAGGIIKALPMLGTQPFLVVSSDIFTDYPFARLSQLQPQQAHLVLVGNLAQQPQGDFCLQGDQVHLTQGRTLTYGNIGVYHPQFFAKQSGEAVVKLGRLLREKIPQGRISGEYSQYAWHNINSIADYENLVARFGG
jgi:MurNAc alpha-1-phosphate uridylyltransferase